MNDNSKLNYITSQISDILVGKYASRSPTSSRKNLNHNSQEFNVDV